MRDQITKTLYFNKENPNWDKSNEFNKLFVKSNLIVFQRQLNIRGFVLATDIYQALGFSPTQDILLFGWTEEESYFKTKTEELGDGLRITFTFDYIPDLFQQQLNVRGFVLATDIYQALGFSLTEEESYFKTKTEELGDGLRITFTKD